MHVSTKSDRKAGRRAFVRLVGGGAILAAGGIGAGCSRQLPPEAIEAWNGPSPSEPDVRRWILAHAILAPHSHNLQSWLVDLRTPGEMLLRCDLARLLPQTDPFSRQIMMSHGTFIELLDIAARERGQRAEVTLFPEGPFDPDKLDARPVARVRLVSDAAVARDALFAQILRRHTNRNAYDAARAVPPAAWQAMAAAVRPYPLRFGFVGADQSAALQRHRAIAAEAWRIELTTPAAILESFKVLRVGAAEVARHRDGLTLMDPLAVWLARVGL
ncbi:MAG TPA: twin-arginine translocation pathway signal protein, partial [Burkholderiaceae bacterium]|nr:twin-arginine translocation pathway signal protein [Burkholderiaceae bacterium]